MYSHRCACPGHVALPYMHVMMGYTTEHASHEDVFTGQAGHEGVPTGRVYIGHDGVHHWICRS